MKAFRGWQKWCASCRVADSVPRRATDGGPWGSVADVLPGLLGPGGGFDRFGDSGFIQNSLEPFNRCVGLRGESGDACGPQHTGGFWANALNLPQVVGGGFGLGWRAWLG